MNPPRKRELLYEGKGKILYKGTKPGTVIQYFKDDTTAFNNQKRQVISGKGVLNNRISEFIMTQLEEIGIKTHFIKTLNMREQLVKQVEIIPVEVIVRNYAAGSFAKRFNVKEGVKLSDPMVEFCYKSDELGDPVVSDEHIAALGLAGPMEMSEIKMTALRINDFMSGLFAGVGIRLIDFKVEFGRLYRQNDYFDIVLADEISPDSCRLWDMKTSKVLDKDIFRKDLGNLVEAYHEVATRLGIIIDNVTEAIGISDSANAAIAGADKTKNNNNKKASVPSAEDNATAIGS